MDFIDIYGDALDVVLRAPLWTDLYRGRIMGLLWYPRRGRCGWRFNYDGWVKWGCHGIATWLTQANTSAGYNDDVSLLHDIYIYIRMFTFYIYLYTYVSTRFFFFKKTLVDSCLILARRA